MDVQTALRDPTRVWTYDDLAQIEDDRHRYEIIDGELIASPAPRLRHQAVSKRLLVLLYELLERTGEATVYAAPVDVILSPHRVVEPDLVAVRRDRSEIMTVRAIEAAPDLAVEILSPSTAHVGRGKKQALYGKVRIPEYWLVDAEANCIDVLTPDASGVMQLHARFEQHDRLVSPTLDSVAFDLAPIFAD